MEGTALAYMYKPMPLRILHRLYVADKISGSANSAPRFRGLRRT
jgi:hypothetical protein